MKRIKKRKRKRDRASDDSSLVLCTNRERGSSQDGGAPPSPPETVHFARQNGEAKASLLSPNFNYRTLLKFFPRVHPLFQRVLHVYFGEAAIGNA